MKTEEDKLLLATGIANLAIGRPFAAPPDVPADRIAVLRDAFTATFADPKFLNEAASMNLPVNNPRTGLQLAQVIAETYKTPRPIIDRLRLLYAQ
jgi:tripartite-type tricarboxylate transporter receptor subunit TctC